MKAITFLLVFLISSHGGAATQSGDPVLTALDQARQAYDASEEAFRKAVVDRLTAAEDRAVKAGKKAIVDQIGADRTAFETTGALPKSIKVTDLPTQRSQARHKLQAAYTRAISDLTKSRRAAEADAVEREAAAFQSKFAADLVKPGTVWRGDKRYLKGGRPGNHAFELRIVDRAGDSFRGVVIEDPDMTHDVEGTVTNDRIEWKNTRTRVGIYPGQPQKGTFEGETMKLHFAGRQKFDNLPVEAEATLQLQKKKDGAR
mgnify:CR=1 FL=1